MKLTMFIKNNAIVSCTLLGVIGVCAIKIYSDTETIHSLKSANSSGSATAMLKNNSAKAPSQEHPLPVSELSQGHKTKSPSKSKSGQVDAPLSEDVKESLQSLSALCKKINAVSNVNDMASAVDGGVFSLSICGLSPETLSSVLARNSDLIDEFSKVFSPEAVLEFQQDIISSFLGVLKAGDGGHIVTNHLLKKLQEDPRDFESLRLAIEYANFGATEEQLEVIQDNLYFADNPQMLAMNLILLADYVASVESKGRAASVDIDFSRFYEHENEEVRLAALATFNKKLPVQPEEVLSRSLRDTSDSVFEAGIYEMDKYIQNNNHAFTSELKDSLFSLVESDDLEVMHRITVLDSLAYYQRLAGNSDQVAQGRIDQLYRKFGLENKNDSLSEPE